MNEKILIVETSKFFSSLLKKEIETKLNFDVTLASSYQDARAVLKSDNEGWFVAILDLNLPDTPDGEIVEAVSQCSIPSIVLSDEFKSEGRDRILPKNVIAYVLKGQQYSIDRVLTLVDRLNRNRSVKVLVVDDEIMNRIFVSSLLKRHKYNVLEAHDGAAALSVFEANPEIKLIITDYNMPNVDGFELTKRLRAKCPGKGDLAIIGMSAQHNSSLSVKFLEYGANDFITKPFVTEEFFCRTSQSIEMIEQINAIQSANELKNKFLGMAAHDLRNPLVSIRGFSELLLDMEPKESSDRREFLETISQVSNQMLSLVNDILDVSAIESGKFRLKLKVSDLNKLVASRVNLMSLNAKKKNIQIIFTPKDPVDSMIDEERIAQVIDNLLSNAVKFSPAGTTVKVITQVRDEKAEFSVSDSGPGVPPEDFKRLFGAFQKLRARPTGGEKSTGLGLAIVKKIVDAHSGEITVSSHIEGGSTFAVKLPKPH